MISEKEQLEDFTLSENEKIKETNIEQRVQKKKEFPKIQYQGKKYVDVTDMFSHSYDYIEVPEALKRN